VRKDQYFTIRYKVNGKDKEEGLGWALENWTAAKAYERLKELKENRKSGEGLQTLAEKRELEQERREQALIEKETLEKEEISFKQIFEGQYMAVAKTDKTWRAWGSEEACSKTGLIPL